MGIIINGLFGNYSGKIGNMVFYQKNGKNMVRTIGKNTVPPSLAQLRARKEMAVATALVQSVLGFVNIGFKPEAIKAKRYPFNMAISYNKKHALQGSYPDIEIDYSKVRLSEGPLPPAHQASVVPVPEGLQFSWFTDPLHPEQSDLDQVMLMAYFPLVKDAVYVLSGTTRAEGTAVLAISEDLRVGTAETYISFITDDRSVVSRNVYIGSVVFPA